MKEKILVVWNGPDGFGIKICEPFKDFSSFIVELNGVDNIEELGDQSFKKFINGNSNADLLNKKICYQYGEEYYQFFKLSSSEPISLEWIKPEKEDYECPDCKGAQFVFNWDEYKARDISKEFGLVMECYNCKKHHNYKLPKFTHLRLMYPG